MVYVDGFVLYCVVIINEVNVFLICNESNGILFVNKFMDSVFVGLDILNIGKYYFIVNIDFIFCCDFGLWLNVSVKENNCRFLFISEMCFGWG